jgi:hypothetical protein
MPTEPLPITDSQDEQSFEELFRDAQQVEVPIFQRSYIWKKKQFDELVQDIRLISDGEEDTQFLGAIVTYERPRPRESVGWMRVLDVVDGQQRLLTLYVFVMAIAEALARHQTEDAAEIVQALLLLPPRRGLDVNTRVIPSYGDRNQFRALWDRLNSPEVLQESLRQNPPSPPPPSGHSSGDLQTQYLRITRYLEAGAPASPGDRSQYLKRLLEIVTRRLSFVQLQLRDASSATKIFERLNFRGVRVGIVDLARNEIFSRVSNEPQVASRIFHHRWQPFQASLNGRAERFFFPYCLIHDSNTTKSDLFTVLRRLWAGLEPEQIVDHMEPFRGPFLMLDSPDAVHHDDGLEVRLGRLRRARMPTVVYPFLMKVLVEYDGERLDGNTCQELLEVVESFLIRRAILGYEPTGLHALFKGLWGEIEEDPRSPTLQEAIFRRPTIQWPTDSEMKDAVGRRPLGKARICRYLLSEYDQELPGDTPSDVPTIEHVLPQSYTEGSRWSELFTREEHRAKVDLWANLIPLSSPLNESLQAKAYPIKKERYEQESMFVTPRRVAAQWEEWTPAVIEERTALLAEWAVRRWRHGGQ